MDAAPSASDGGAPVTGGDATTPTPPPPPQVDGGPVPPYPLEECVAVGDPYVLILDGEPGNPVHPGREVFTSASWMFQSTHWDVENMMDIDLLGQWNALWLVRVATQHPEEPPQLGTYDPAVWPDYGEGAPLLVVRGQFPDKPPTTCDAALGRFVLHAAHVSEAGQGLLQFAATFELRCNATAPALRGCVTYRYP